MDYHYMRTDYTSDPFEAYTWPTDEKSYEIGNIIGIGAVSVTHEAYCIPLDVTCAVKKLSLGKSRLRFDEILKRMFQCKHENLLTYYTGFFVGDELWLVVRLMECGSLLDIIKHKMHLTNCENGVFDEVMIATLLKGVLKALQYLHYHKEVHKYVKAGNILLGADGVLKLADFGVSDLLAHSIGELKRPNLRNTFAGTPCWMAPEVMGKNHIYDSRSDIWSFGITAIELATGHPPYYKNTSMKTLMLTLTNDPPDLDTAAEYTNQYKSYGNVFRDLIDVCLQKEPHYRPTATELLKHPFFDKAEDTDYLLEHLVPSGPNTEARAQLATKRVRVSSGRLHRKVIDNWSSDEESEHVPTPHVEEGLKLGAASEGSCDSESIIETTDIIHLVLRTREPHQQFHSSYEHARELFDIDFDFVCGKDSPEGIANELVSAGLVDSRDVMAIANNLQTLIEATDGTRSITFKLNSISGKDFVDEKLLVGYAQFSIVH